MNSRDREYIKRELSAWGWWLRQGRTWPNRLGYKPATVEYRIMRGDTGGSGAHGSAVPNWFNLDKSVEKVDLIVLKLPDPQLATVSGIYVRGMSQRDLASKFKISRGKVQYLLNNAYIDIHKKLIRP